MSIESPADWKGLRAAARVARLTLDRLERETRAGRSTADLDGLAAALFGAHGARSAPGLTYGFPGTVLISVNDEIVHGVPGPRVIAAGDLVKLDVTVRERRVHRRHRAHRCRPAWRRTAHAARGLC